MLCLLTLFWFESELILYLDLIQMVVLNYSSLIDLVGWLDIVFLLGVKEKRSPIVEVYYR